MRISAAVLVAGLTALGCTKKSDESKAPAAATPEFDQKWSALADKELEVFYIEDDRGEGLMGNVRRAKRGNGDALSAKVDDTMGTPATAGDVHDTRVDAPAFQGTSLPGCVLGMVSHWVFPKSQKGGLAISYPFVFVGG